MAKLTLTPEEWLALRQAASRVPMAERSLALVAALEGIDALLDAANAARDLLGDDRPVGS